MKKVLIITSMCTGLICVWGNAEAATKCVALNSSTTCTSSPSTGSLDWSATCTTDGNSVAISGIAGCSSQNGGSMGAKSDTISTSSTTEDNMYCWCKMTSPAVSSWVFFSDLGSAANCAIGCASSCAYGVRSNAAFRSALFSGLGD